MVVASPLPAAALLLLLRHGDLLDVDSRDNRSRGCIGVRLRWSALSVQQFGRGRTWSDGAGLRPCLRPHPMREEQSGEQRKPGGFPRLLPRQLPWVHVGRSGRGKINRSWSRSAATPEKRGCAPPVVSGAVLCSPVRFGGWVPRYGWRAFAVLWPCQRAAGCSLRRVGARPVWTTATRRAGKQPGNQGSSPDLFPGRLVRGELRRSPEGKIIGGCGERPEPAWGGSVLPCRRCLPRSLRLTTAVVRGPVEGCSRSTGRGVRGLGPRRGACRRRRLTGGRDRAGCASAGWSVRWGRWDGSRYGGGGRGR